ncbi:conserved exported hypothetical protein [Paraburkholderia piptadeniae]|uniref:OmpA-like domain-containing protein n=1 Tax=Paraburkholderia piptadeniae TaxID=1701573 RepID=A0A1N7SHS7_9BURK|nr:hypothetical protein [Paraburkholderia piptadeniae]SIT46937.1 conserved exported hypothetical protein [Paraburkholderia piptadeniae]
MSKRRNFLSSVVAVALAISGCLYGSASACTIGEEAQAHLPFNTTTLSNVDRLAIADIVIEAKRWPDVQIQAVVIAGAYIGERNVDRLKEARAENVKAYLQQLGIKSENILIDKKTFTDEMVVKRPDGTFCIRQVVVELTPICKGSCAWLCDDPRVTPHSRAIK